MMLPKIEQETVLTFMRDESQIEVFTSDTTMITKFDNLCKKNPKAYKHVRDSIVNGDITGKTYLMPKRFLSFRTGISKKSSESRN